jgi:hypothetical protein
MLATIRKIFRPVAVAIVGSFAIALVSCATKETALINDPNERKETALPWNEQTKWEREGEAGAINQQRR